MKKTGWSLLFFYLVLHAQQVSASDKLSEYCQIRFEQDGACPQEICQVACNGGVMSAECEKVCLPRPCLQIKAEACPAFACRVLTGCNNEQVCYPLSDFDPPECGSLAYEGQDVPCCEGLVKRCGVEFFDGICDMAGTYTMNSVPMCIPCGNGICNQFEDTCNCPEDCGPDY